MAQNFFMLTLLVVLLLSKSFDLISASRPPHIHPPTIPRGSLLNKVKPPSFHAYTANRYKLTESEAFRPTSPGHSPGVGHKGPPGSD